MTSSGNTSKNKSWEAALERMASTPMLHENFERLLTATLETARDYYGARLVTLAIFGSVAWRSSQKSAF